MESSGQSPSRFKKSRVTAAATMFVALVCLVLVALTGWNVWNAYKNEIMEAQVTTENMGRSLAQHADDTFKAASIGLVAVAERVKGRDISIASLQSLQGLLTLIVDEQPALSAIYVLDKNGFAVASSRGLQMSIPNSSDREYFQFHRNSPDLSAHIGLPVRSRVTRQWIIPVSHRLDGPNGEFAGVAVGSIELDYFNRFYARFDIGHDGIVLLVLKNGTQLTRWPLLSDSIGKDVTGTPVLALYAANAESGNARVESPADGKARILGYDHLQHFSAIAVAALSEREILDTWRTATLVQSVVLVVVILLLGFLGYRLIGQIGLRIQAEEEARKAGEALLALNKRLEKLALQDGLTGLANRRQFDISFQNELSRAKRLASSLALIMIDVDFFKKYNDIYGHLAGDECLRTVGKAILNSGVRAGDLAARYGGEEFAVLLPSTDVQGALLVAEEIRTAIQKLEIAHGGNDLGVVTISAGINAFTPMGSSDSPATLIAAADKALYEAKSAGRNKTCVYHAETATVS